MNLANSTMKKNFVPIVDFSESPWAFARLLLLFVSIAARLTMPFWSQICASFAQYWNLACSNEATNYSCRKSILVGSNGGYGLHPQERPIFGKVLSLDYSQSFDYGILDLVWIDHGFLGTTFSCISSSTGWPYGIPCLPAFYHIGVCEVVLSWWRTPELKEGPSCNWWIADSLLFLYARSARTCNKKYQCSSMMNILCTASWVLSRAIHITRCSQHPESFVLILDWKDLMIDFVVDLVDERVDLGGSQSPESILERWYSAHASQQNVVALEYGSPCLPRSPSSVHDFRHEQQWILPFFHELLHHQCWAYRLHDTRESRLVLQLYDE